MAPTQPGYRKRKGKAQFVLAKRAGRCSTSGPHQQEPGLQGMLITCNLNERKCVEAYSLLNAYGDIYRPEKFTDKDQQPSGSEGEDDVEAALKKEVGDIKASTEMRQKRCQLMESGANNVIFIKTLGIEPEKLVHHILQDMYKTKKKARAFLEDMRKCGETCLEPWFKAPNKGAFQIMYKSRNNSHLNREEVIKKLAGIVLSRTNPQYTVVVEIIKAVCCLSVVKDYVLFRKYNLREVVKSPKDPSQLNSNQGDGKEANLESADKSDQNSAAEQVPENTEELGQTKPMSSPQVVDEGGAKPELANQATEGSKSNENDLS
uniref:THUMP domain-containing protein 1 n=1 Tax=Aotus nancymaae TaxID=37293 RepID=A0A2K5DDF6_AOTNA